MRQSCLSILPVCQALALCKTAERINVLFLAEALGAHAHCIRKKIPFPHSEGRADLAHCKVHKYKDFPFRSPYGGTGCDEAFYFVLITLASVTKHTGSVGYRSRHSPLASVRQLRQSEHGRGCWPNVCRPVFQQGC